MATATSPIPTSIDDHPGHNIQIYIRHGSKLYKQGSNPRNVLDPPLIRDWHHYYQASYIKSILLNTFGIPNYIFCSPYVRTRQTAEDLGLTTEDYKIDKDLCEYVGQEFLTTESDIDISTKELGGVILGEDKQDFRTRVHERFVRQPPGISWHVCHGYFMRVLGKLLGYKYSVHYLDALVVIDNFNVCMIQAPKQRRGMFSILSSMGDWSEVLIDVAKTVDSSSVSPLMEETSFEVEDEDFISHLGL